MNDKNAQNAIDVILHDATGKRASGREFLVSQKRSILEPDAAKTLKEQWKGSGRDNALVVMKLSEQDGSNPHYVTGWDGKDTFVCMTESGLTYIDQRKLEKLSHDSKWNPETRLIEIRAPLLRESMERSDVNMLLDRIKRTLTKSGKGRRKGRLRNMDKFFAAAIVDESSTNAEKAAASGPSSETEFVKVGEKDDRIPEAPKAPSTSKLPKGRATESFNWDLMDKNGRPARRRLNHPWMESSKTEPELDKRERVDVRGEGGGGSGGATPGGNKTDPQLSDREQVDTHQESVRSRTDPGMGGPPHRGGHPVGSPAYHREAPTGGTPAFQAAAQPSGATSMRPGGKTYSNPWSPGQGRNSPMGDATRSEKRAANKKLRRSGNRDARQSGEVEAFRRMKRQGEGLPLAASTDPELDKRELVQVGAEGGGGGGGATAGGNKTDAQLGNREQVSVRSEDAATDSSDKSDDPDYTTYAGDKAKGASSEFSSRPKIAVRHEALGSKKAKKLFGPASDKKSPEGAKKPLLMLVLMSKGKKSPMSEDRKYCPRCGTTSSIGRSSAFGPMRTLFTKPEPSKANEPIHDTCPTCKDNREKTGGKLKLKVSMPSKPKSQFESRLDRRRLNLVEGKRKLHPTFLANIEKMKEKARARKAATLASN